MNSKLERVADRRGGAKRSWEWWARACSGVGLLVLGVGCGGGGGLDAGAPIPGADQLLAALQGRSITALPAAPTVSDPLMELGQALFFDKVLSGNQDVSCATCHWPELASADARTLPQGSGGTGVGVDRRFGTIVPRNSPAIFNTHSLDGLFWDSRIERDGAGIDSPAGAALTTAMIAILDPQWDLVAVQAMFPPISREEMRGEIGENTIADLADGGFVAIWDALRDRVVALPGYQTLLAAAYPGTALSSIEFAHLANAIAAFEVRAFTLNDSPFERFVGGDAQALTAEQVVGALEFFGAGNCASCHTGALFTDERFHNIGLPQFGPGVGDGAGSDDDFGRERVTGNAVHRYRFRTPMLRNVAITAPYGHLGQYSTLTAMVDHYRDAENRLMAYVITEHVSDTAISGTFLENRTEIASRLAGQVRNPRQFDVAAIVAFLEALTDPAAEDMGSLIPASVPSGVSVR